MLRQRWLGLKCNHGQVGDQFAKVNSEHSRVRTDVEKHISGSEHPLATLHDIGVPAPAIIVNVGIYIEIIGVDRQSGAVSRRDKE
jgi:hypothetical protein